MLLSFSTLNAQETKFRDQAWRYGISGAAQFNTVSLGWQTLHGTDQNFHSEEGDIDRVDGHGWGVYASIFGMYLSDSWWGVQFQVSYDQRNALIEDNTRTPIPSFDTKLDYIGFCPSFRVDQNFIPNLSFHVGPFINVNINGTYVYKPDKDKSAEEPRQDISRRNIATYGFAGGLSYDIKVAEINNNCAMRVSPFADVSWLVNQRKSEGEPSQNSVTDIWSTLSFRVGVALSLDYRKPADEVQTEYRTEYKTEYITIYTPTPIPIIKNKVFVVMPTDNTILTKNIAGYFPILPYVFFEKDNTNIPNRYTALTYSEAQNFDVGELDNFMKGDLTQKETNINQLMRVYYNNINIFGDRMRDNPNEQLMLRGSDPEEKNGYACAEAVKTYLVDKFGINANRITIEVDPPYRPSGSSNTDPQFAGLINDENRKVKFVFSNPKMTAPLKYTIRDESSIDNDMDFYIAKNVPFKSWDITITGEGKTMYFGPYSSNSARINPAELMRFLESGKYKATVVLTEQNGTKSEESVTFTLTKDKELKNAARYLMIFEYNSSDAVASYEKIIRNEITPGMVVGNRVIVHGHTDNIGSEQGNLLLSQERADQAKSIIDDQLRIENKKINVQALGVGQSKVQYSFDNKYPEGRMYNRNIFVEVFPNK